MLVKQLFQIGRIVKGSRRNAHGHFRSGVTRDAGTARLAQGLTEMIDQFGRILAGLALNLKAIGQHRESFSPLHLIQLFQLAQFLVRVWGNVDDRGLGLLQFGHCLDVEVVLVPASLLQPGKGQGKLAAETLAIEVIAGENLGRKVLHFALILLGHARDFAFKRVCQVVGYLFFLVPNPGHLAHQGGGVELQLAALPVGAHQDSGVLVGLDDVSAFVHVGEGAVLHLAFELTGGVGDPIAGDRDRVLELFQVGQQGRGHGVQYPPQQIRVALVGGQLSFDQIVDDFGTGLPVFLVGSADDRRGGSVGGKGFPKGQRGRRRFGPLFHGIFTQRF